MSQEFSWQDFVINEESEISFFNSLFSYIKDYIQEAVEHLLLILIYYTVICILLYMAIIKWRMPPFKKEVENPKRVLIVTAHPDDECMFFGPTVLNLLRTSNCTVYLLCLSIGSNYGMGRIRKNELYRACSALGINSNNIIIKSHTNMPDSINVKWPTEIIENIISQQIETYSIDTLITFDRYGISRHPNHTSIYYAVANLSLDKKLPHDCTVYVLETVNISRKYSLIFDIPLCFLLSRTRYMVSFSDRLIIYKAMMQHRSQIVWFRWLYTCFSRYMLINTLQRMDMSDIELDLELED